MLKMLDLFSGIGGISLGAEMTGCIETVGFCEIEEYPVKVLEKRCPNVPIFRDVTTLTADTLRERGIARPDIIAGGFPCQPFSVAGKRRGKEDERFLWGEFARLIRELRPRWIVGENVPGIINIAADDVLGDLEDLNYSATAFVFPATAVGAPHRRERCFFVANTGRSLQPWPVFGREDGMEGREQDAYKPERPGGTLGGMNWPTPSARDYKGARCQETFDETGRNELTNSLPDAIRSQAQGQLNPDWVEMLMGFDIGWTDIDCDEPTPWPGWPAPLGVKGCSWPTPTAADVYTNNMQSSQIKDGSMHSVTLARAVIDERGQNPYEPPRSATVSKNRAKRLKALGNAVVPQQIYPIFWAITQLEGVE